MPFVRFSRDRRGYEHTYLVHESAGRGRPLRTRILYWFRTPPGIKIGREPFDADARRKIESQNPGLSFDWEAIASTPMPPVPEVEHWRERRRAERAAKVARRENERDNDADDERQDPGEPERADLPDAAAAAHRGGEGDQAAPQRAAPASHRSPAATAPLANGSSTRFEATAAVDPEPPALSTMNADPGDGSADDGGPTAGGVQPDPENPARKRRRRRNSRRRRVPAAGSGIDAVPGSAAAPSDGEDGGNPADAGGDQEPKSISGSPALSQAASGEGVPVVLPGAGRETPQD